MAGDPFLDDEAALGRVRALCRGFEGADEGDLQGRPLFRVGRRRFAIFNGALSPDRPRWRGCGRSLHFVVPRDELEAFSQDERFAQSPHHGTRGWFALRLEDPSAAEWREIRELLASAHRLVAPRHVQTD